MATCIARPIRAGRNAPKRDGKPRKDRLGRLRNLSGLSQAPVSRGGVSISIAATRPASGVSNGQAAITELEVAAEEVVAVGAVAVNG